MSCSKLVPFGAALVSLLGLSAATAYGYDSDNSLGQEELTLRSLKAQPYTIELKPLPTAVSAAGGNGTGSLGIGGEIFASPRVAIYTDATYTDLTLPNNLAKKADNANQGQAVPKSMIGYTVTPGVRFYGAPAGSTWYGQAGVGYGTQSGSFHYNNSTVDSRSAAIMPTVAAGYRWLFSNNMLIRTGVGAVGNAVQSHSETANNSNAEGRDGENKVSKLVRTPVIATIDLGLGYAF